MIVANLATYPPRRSLMLETISALSKQVDRINIVLNEYPEIAPELTRFENVASAIPDRDTKDTGKFLPDVAEDDTVFLIDDDIAYPDDYVARTLSAAEAHGWSGTIFGYHGSIYRRRPFSLRKKQFRKWLNRKDKRLIAQDRHVFEFYKGMETPVEVEQLGTGTVVMQGRYLPAFSYMASSQKFVDVRLAKWCHENGLRQIALPRSEGWMGKRETGETIYQSFTRMNPPDVADEIATYAFKLSDRSGSKWGK